MTSTISLPTLFHQDRTIHTHLPKSAAAAQVITTLALAALNFCYPQINCFMSTALLFNQTVTLHILPEKKSWMGNVASLALAFFLSQQKWMAHLYVKSAVSAALVAKGLHIAYSNFVDTDPMVKAFHQIAGGKEAYEALPFVSLDIQVSPDDDFKDLPPRPAGVHDCLFYLSRQGMITEDLTRSNTLDGREILVAKSSRKDKKGHPYYDVFIEKYNWTQDIYGKKPSFEIGLTHLLSGTDDREPADSALVFHGENSSHKMREVVYWPFIPADIAKELKNRKK